MEVYEIDPIKIEKQKAMRRYKTFRKIATVIRTLEFLLAFSLLFFSVSFSSAYLPSAVDFISAFLRRSFSVLFSPHFVFVIGNLIVLTLFINSGDHDHPPLSAADHSSSEILAGDIFPVTEMKEEREREMEVRSSSSVVNDREKSYRRTKSLMIVVKKDEEEKKKLRRSETVPRRKIRESPATVKKEDEDEDDLSGEEFRRKVEAFIEKQQRFLRQESMAVVLRNTTNPSQSL